MDKLQKRAFIATQIKTAAGREMLASNMNKPLREYRDYTSVGRRAFEKDPLPDGALPYYDKDPEMAAFVVGEEGEDIRQIGKGKRVFVPLFEIATLVEIPLTQIRERRYDLQARVKERTKVEVIKVEDQRIFGLISAVGNSSAGNAPLAIEASKLTITQFSEAMGLIEKWGDIRVENIFMNPRWNTVLRKINSTENGYHIDFTTSKTLLANGNLGTLYGSTISTSSQVPEDEIYFTGEKEFTGTLVEAQSLSVLSADNPAARAIGYAVFEQIGLLLHNPKAISMLKIGL